jgi:hypothetical protein
MRTITGVLAFAAFSMLSGAEAADGRVPVALSQEGLAGTSWVLVRENGSPSIKEIVLAAGGAIGGGAEGGMIERWEVAASQLVFWGQGESKFQIFDRSQLSPMGQPVLLGHMADATDIPARLLLSLTEDERRAVLTTDALAGMVWTLRNHDGSVVQARIELQPGGAVSGVPANDPFIGGWSAKDGELTLEKDGRATFRFSFPTEDAEGHRALNGYLTMNPYQELTLVEVAP